MLLAMQEIGDMRILPSTSLDADDHADLWAHAIPTAKLRFHRYYSIPKLACFGQTP